MEHTGHRERLRKRFEINQFHGFSEHEVLELLLTFAIPRIDVNPLAHRLTETFGSLAGVLEASKEELQQVPGMGEKSATLLTMMLPLMQRYQQGTILSKPRFSTYSALAAYCASLFLGKREEQFYLLCFDAKMQLTKVLLLGTGTADEVRVSPKQVVREAMRCNAVSAAVTHNHPSGDPLPSQDDIDLTGDIQQALAMVEIRLVDHVIVGGHETYSLKRSGYIEIPMESEMHLAAEQNEMKRKTKWENKKCREDENLL